MLFKLTFLNDFKWVVRLKTLLLRFLDLKFGDYKYVLVHAKYKCCYVELRVVEKYDKND